MMERAAGIEPACLTWKDSALPLSYARLFRDSFYTPKHLGKTFSIIITEIITIFSYLYFCIKKLAAYIDAIDHGFRLLITYKLLNYNPVGRS